MGKKVLLIDGNNLLHRAFHALPESLSTSTGQPTNALYGLAQMLLLLLEEQAPDAALVAFDAPGKTFRHEQFADYKANRPPMDEALASQVELAHELVEALGLPQTELAGYEADDIIGTVARRAAGVGDQVLIVTGDRDVLQLIGDDVKVLATLRGLSDTRLYDIARVEEEYDIRPDQVTDHKALAGDSSDNIPGVPGIGPKTAVRLLEQFPHVEDLLAQSGEVESEKLSAKIAEHRDTIKLSKALATIDTDSPVDLDLDGLHALFHRLLCHVLCGHLCRKRSALPGALELHRSGTGPTYGVSTHIGDRDQRIVERRLDMSDPVRDVLFDLLFLGPFFGLSHNLTSFP